jgi:predicted 3-demethylubiquinone-9 3-methyltransferase (glyoxalase superfamily)
MQKIIPHLWFNKEAKEAAEFYASVFPEGKVTSVTTIRDTPSGDCDIVTFELSGYKFMGISAGPHFKLNPSISFMLNFDPSKDAEAETRLNELWEKLSEGGKELMSLQEYPFSKRYGWIQDKYGVTWQLILTNPEGEERPFIIPSLMFTKDKAGRAEEAIDFYVSVFKDAKKGMIAHYPAGSDEKGTLMFGDFMLEGQWFAAMDSAGPHDFTFSEAISLLISCETQEEIDHYWEKLSAVPESEQCGWLKDKFGVSWQDNYAGMGELMSSDETRDRVTQAFLKMKKFDVAALEAAAKGE